MGHVTPSGSYHVFFFGRRGSPIILVKLTFTFWGQPYIVILLFGQDDLSEQISFLEDEISFWQKGVEPSSRQHEISHQKEIFVSDYDLASRNFADTLNAPKYLPLFNQLSKADVFPVVASLSLNTHTDMHTYILHVL